MSKPNILFIMCDQLRWDYLSCYGHDTLDTPNIDRLAQMGVRFDRAYANSPVCTPSRACFYTGRYMSSHGVTANYSGYRPDELNIGDYLHQEGVRTVLVGKSHATPDKDGLQRLDIDLDSPLGQHIAQAGFEPYWRFDGLYPNDERAKDIEYNTYLRALGYSADSPWHAHANGATAEDGTFRSGWFWENSDLPADIDVEHSETPVTTRKAIEFMEDAATDVPWCLHLSFIKPHWPYIAPEPYASMYAHTPLKARVKADQELEAPHPVLEVLQSTDFGQAYNVPGIYEKVTRAYMGLIKQVDDEIGVLLDYMEQSGLLKNTVIVFTADHGDQLGDHWLGEKTVVHESSMRIPMLIADPRPAADATRGTVDSRFVEAIDLLPTFVELVGGDTTNHPRLEGRSLLPLLHNQPAPNWRQYAVAEQDFSDRLPRYVLDMPDTDRLAIMIRTENWKYVHFVGYRPILFDLNNDPDELHDLGAHPDYAAVRAEYAQHVIDFLMRRKYRITVTEDFLSDTFAPGNTARRGILIGYVTPDDVPEDMRERTHARLEKITQQKQAHAKKMQD